MQTGSVHAGAQTQKAIVGDRSLGVRGAKKGLSRKLKGHVHLCVRYAARPNALFSIIATKLGIFGDGYAIDATRCLASLTTTRESWRQ